MIIFKKNKKPWKKKFEFFVFSVFRINYILKVLSVFIYLKDAKLL